MANMKRPFTRKMKGFLKKKKEKVKDENPRRCSWVKKIAKGNPGRIAFCQSQRKYE